MYWVRISTGLHGLRTRRPRNEGSILGMGKRFFSSVQHPGRLCDLAGLFPPGGKGDRSVKLTIHINLVLRVAMCEAIPPILPYVFMAFSINTETSLSSPHRLSRVKIFMFSLTLYADA
jgi:hypothetical protein